jgi:hypothetical protein
MPNALRGMGTENAQREKQQNHRGNPEAPNR